MKWEELTKLKHEGGMGFRDLALFNDSLLVKQAWRLLKNQDSLFYKGGLYAWSSILHGRDVLERDCRWRIGNEKLVGIWESNWLPRKQDPQVISLICETLAEARVEILIDSELRQWNHGMMEGIFV